MRHQVGVHRSQSVLYADILAALTTTVTPPGQKGVWYSAAAAPNLNDTVTDTQSIVSTALNINQKTTATGAPDQPVNSTTVTAVDGSILSTPVSSTSSRRELSRRSAANYELVFNGTGVGPTDRDASIEGTAYLTFTTVNNATYNVADCLAFCDSVPTCGKFVCPLPHCNSLIKLFPSLR